MNDKTNLAHAIMATVDAAALFWYFMFIVHCRQKEALEEARRGLASGGADTNAAYKTSRVYSKMFYETTS